jgi:glutamate--cysteine ligase
MSAFCYTGRSTIGFFDPIDLPPYLLSQENKLMPKAANDTLITSYDQLSEFFRVGARPRSDWGIGAEMEKLLLDARTGEAADFPRIEALLEKLAQEGEWQRLTENGHLIGLQGPHSSVTLEPGGQLELSGRLCKDLFCNCNDFTRHSIRAVEACRELGLVILGMGTQPFTALDKIEWAPKSRYDIMGPYMLKTGDMGQRMMKQSAGLQVNLDFSDEADCMKKLKLGQALSPLLYALFANSPLLEGKPSGFLTTRGEIWARTDPDRSGMLPFLDNPNAGFNDYVDHALDVPMYFLIRNGQYIDLTGNRFTFRNYLESGHKGIQATMGDWDMHLSTLFTEVRLRPQVEVRSADSLPPQLALTVAALLKGLLYDEEAFAAAWDLCSPEDHKKTEAASRIAWQQGLHTPWGNGTLQDVAKECLDLARSSLDRQKSCTERDRSESYFLDGLDELIGEGKTLAEQLLEKWQGDRSEKLSLLIEHCGFFEIASEKKDKECADAQFKSAN